MEPTQFPRCGSPERAESDYVGRFVATELLFDEVSDGS